MENNFFSNFSEIIFVASNSINDVSRFYFIKKNYFHLISVCIELKLGRDEIV